MTAEAATAAPVRVETAGSRGRRGRGGRRRSRMPRRTAGVVARTAAGIGNLGRRIGACAGPLLIIAVSGSCGFVIGAACGFRDLSERRAEDGAGACAGSRRGRGSVVLAVGPT
jgi:hypothetical protein